MDVVGEIIDVGEVLTGIVHNIENGRPYLFFNLLKSRRLVTTKLYGQFHQGHAIEILPLQTDR